MYPYHNRIKQRIANGELIGYEFIKKYKDISPCLMLYFATEPHTRPIREHRFSEYQQILGFDSNVLSDANDSTAQTDQPPVAATDLAKRQSARQE